MNNTKHIITNKDTKKATCISCHWEMKQHSENVYFCSYPDCSRVGLLTVMAVVEKDKSDYKFPFHDETMADLDKLTIKSK